MRSGDAVKKTLFLKKIYLFILEREREHMCVRWGGGEGERESQADSTLSTEPDAGLDPRTLRSRPELKARARRLTDCAPQGFPQAQVF